MFEPSHADIEVTKSYKNLCLFDVRVLERLLVMVDGAVSFKGQEFI